VLDRGRVISYLDLGTVALQAPSQREHDRRREIGRYVVDARSVTRPATPERRARSGGLDELLPAGTLIALDVFGLWRQDFGHSALACAQPVENVVLIVGQSALEPASEGRRYRPEHVVALHEKRLARRLVDTFGAPGFLGAVVVPLDNRLCG
jgi:hypothetical protein